MQAHVDDEVKGRVFVLYDMVFNVALVLAAFLATLVLPANGKSVPILVVLAASYLVIALLFALVSRGVSMNEGTESLDAAAAACLKLSTSAGLVRATRRAVRPGRGPAPSGPSSIRRSSRNA